eukprot:948592_1
MEGAPNGFRRLPTNAILMRLRQCFRRLSTNTILMMAVATFMTILCITYHTKLTKKFTKFYDKRSFRQLWSLLKLMCRYLLFSLCMISYFWKAPPQQQDLAQSPQSSEDITTSSTQPKNFKALVLQYTDSILNHFLQITFTAFWPRRVTTHTVIHVVSYLNVIVLPLLYICSGFCRGHGSWTFFRTMKYLRRFVQQSLFIYGVYLGKQYFRRPPIYPKDVKFAKMPWKRYRNLDASTGQRTMRKSSRSSKWILCGLLFTCVLEAYLMEYQRLNRREGARILDADRSNYALIFHKFITGKLGLVIFPLFVYPEVLVLIVTLCFSSWGRKLIKGLCTYGVLISGHVTVVTILSLVLVWEIERFDCDLRCNLIDTFQKTSDAKASAKRRLYIFDQIKIKRDELIPHLSVLFHYLIIDRLLFMISDFWNFTCDQNIDFNMAAFIARHLFQLVLTTYVVLKMALFNVNWPYQLIDTVRRWRLQSWISSVDQGTSQKYMKSKPETNDFKEMESLTKTDGLLMEPSSVASTRSYYDSTRYFLDREYELWSQYLSQERFVKRFGFRIFGYRVDIRWFTLSFAFQLSFIVVGMTKTYFGSASERMCGLQDNAK